MRSAARLLIAAALPLLGVAPAHAAREPVLSQVALPHTYYWRELYIPQLTTGPSAAAFMPGGEELVYSMAGSLWRQRIDGTEAIELTHADRTYDYQPDVAPDGRRVVFTRYDGRAMELWQLDLESGETRALTANEGVNVEPRISPDGRRIAWVSTVSTGHFDLRIAELTPAGLADERFLVPPRQSRIDRYYYSTHDHAINPSWSPDGQRVFFVSNAEIPWGTGIICSVAVDGAPAPSPECLSRHQFETSWAARPEVAPDGRRILFSNYHGGQWHQLWLTTTDDAAPLPLAYGEFDRRNARWSPDGARIAYVSNETGNTTLWVQDFFGGARRSVIATERRWLRPAATLSILVRDGTGNPIAARVSVLGGDGRWHAPRDAWMHGDEAYDRTLFPSELHYFHCQSPCRLELPAGSATVHAQSGPRRLPIAQAVQLAAGQTADLNLELAANDLPASFGKFASADLHVHMNYGGHYHNTPERMLAQAAAEDLDVVQNLIVNKEERIPDVAYFRPDADPASGARMLLHAQEYHTSFWGHLGLLHLSDHLLLPDYTSYRHTPLASPWPHNGVVSDLARAQGALVGYVHVADFPIDPPKEKLLSYQLPADVAAGKADYLEVMGFSDHHITAGIWYRLLNLGYRVPAGAGTDAMANYASLRGPAGLVRVFLDVSAGFTPESLRDSLRAGRSFVTNTALLGLEIAGERPGGVIPAAGRLQVSLAMRSPVPMDHLELVQNGRVLRSFKLGGDRRRHDWSGEITLRQGGWVVLRAWNDAPHPQVLDLYPYATTSPIYVASPTPPPAPADAAYFAAWMDRVVEAAQARDGWNSEAEKTATLEYLNAARMKFHALAATVEGTRP